MRRWVYYWAVVRVWVLGFWRWWRLWGRFTRVVVKRYGWFRVGLFDFLGYRVNGVKWKVNEFGGRGKERRIRWSALCQKLYWIGVKNFV